MLSDDLKCELFAYVAGIIKRLKAMVVLINGPMDHVHLLFVLPPSLSLSDLMEKLKANSSKWVNERRAGRRLAWQTGYTAFSVSQSNLDAVKKYIGGQEEHHRRLSYQEEILAFLKKHGIRYDPGRVFE